MKKIAMVILMLMTPVVTQASEGVKRETVERLLEVMNAEAIIDGMYSQMDKMFVGVGQQLGVKESEQQIFDSYMKKVTAAMREEMTWEKLRGPMVDIYIKHYTEKEVNDLLAFYSTESGQSMIRKMPLVMQESMQISQTMLQGFMPKVKVLSIEFKEELVAARSK